MEMLSKEYGWLPNEIRNQKASDIHKYIKVISMKRNLEKIEMMKLRKK